MEPAVDASGPAISPAAPVEVSNVMTPAESLKANATNEAATAAPTISTGASILVPPAESSKPDVANELVQEAAGASVADTDTATATSHARPTPRRLPPSTSLGGLDAVQPYEGLPRKTSLANNYPTIRQTGGRGRETEMHIDDERDGRHAQLPRGESLEAPFHGYERRPRNMPGAPQEAHESLDALRSPLDLVRSPLLREHSYDGREYPGQLPPPRSTTESLAGSVGDRQQWERASEQYRGRDSGRMYGYDHPPHDRNYRERSHDLHDYDNPPREHRRSYYDNDRYREHRPYHGHRPYSPEYTGGRYEREYGRERERYMYSSREYMHEHEPYGRHPHLRPPSPYERSRRSHSRSRGRSPYDAPVASGSRRSPERDHFAPYAAGTRTPILAPLDTPALESLESHPQNE